MITTAQTQIPHQPSWIRSLSLLTLVCSLLTPALTSAGERHSLVQAAPPRSGISFETSPAPVRPIELKITTRPVARIGHNVYLKQVIVGYDVYVNGALRLQLDKDPIEQRVSYTYQNTAGNVRITRHFPYSDYERIVNMIRRASDSCPVSIFLDLSYEQGRPTVNINRVRETCDHLSQAEPSGDVG